jgi:glycosidase
MKYLFFFKGQPLLLSCVCCKIAIQEFLRGLHKKIRKFTDSHRRIYRRTINRRYFTESCKKNYGILPHSPTNFRRISDANTDGITDGLAHACLTRVRLHNYRWNCRRPIPTALPTDHTCLTRVRLHHYRRIEKFGGIFEHFWCKFQLISDGITDGN